MKRIAINELVKWKERNRRKPLIVEGARQVGKTWLIKEFGKTYYDEIAYINFEEKKALQNLFKSDYDIQRILFAVKTATNTKMIAGKTLIVLDEIQEAEGGITSLKYFAENAPEHHVIAAGSLLGVELHKRVSFPVGKVEFLRLHPLCFEEFLMALGENNLVDLLHTKDWQTIQLFAERYKLLLKKYYYVGGMPESVLSFVEQEDLDEVRKIQIDILSTYERDFSKHAPSEIVPRIRQLWNSIPSQLSKENRKFIYGLVKEGARAREYETALSWIKDSGLMHQVFCVKAPRLPLKSYEDLSAFKIYLLDVGLLSAMCELNSDTLLNGNLIFTEFKGALTEQYVMQELNLRHSLYYWAKSKSEQKVDFLIQKDGNVVPVEVKAEENLHAKSLRSFVSENSSPLAIRTSMSNYREEGWMTNIPLYCVGEI
ncbi:MAG: ATP-binding protein [Paludibacteraceae bacterium]|nr:ATP-binding protein [Paludibacteraceae bacterium]